jgi:hypothetical protein
MVCCLAACNIVTSGGIVYGSDGSLGGQIRFYGGEQGRIGDVVVCRFPSSCGGLLLQGYLATFPYKVQYVLPKQVALLEARGRL